MSAKTNPFTAIFQTICTFCSALNKGASMLERTFSAGDTACKSLELHAEQLVINTERSIEEQVQQRILEAKAATKDQPPFNL